MAKGIYVGVGPSSQLGAAHRVKKIYVGVGPSSQLGVAHRVKKIYVGVGPSSQLGVAHLCYSSSEYTSGLYSIDGYDHHRMLKHNPDTLEITGVWELPADYIYNGYSQTFAMGATENYFYMFGRPYTKVNASTNGGTMSRLEPTGATIIQIIDNSTLGGSGFLSNYDNQFKGVNNQFLFTDANSSKQNVFGKHSESTFEKLADVTMQLSYDISSKMILGHANNLVNIGQARSYDYGKTDECNGATGLRVRTLPSNIVSGKLTYGNDLFNGKYYYSMRSINPWSIRTYNEIRGIKNYSTLEFIFSQRTPHDEYWSEGLVAAN